MQFSKSILALSVLGGLACQAAEYRVTGPYSHDNLSIFLIHGANRMNKQFLTLQEAMTQHKVVVYETGNVNRLAVENVSSDEDIYIQSGDIVKGGQQDRVLKDDIILQSKSGRVAVDSFCVEHGRWTQRGNEQARAFGSSAQSIASKDLKIAVRQKADQQQVWDKVAEMQSRLSSNLKASVAAPASATSLQLTLENENVKNSADTYKRDFTSILSGQGDVVGYAFAVNGKISSADVYASNDLFRKLWPKLLEASIVEAIAGRRGNERFDEPAKSSVTEALNSPRAIAGPEQQVNARTASTKKESDSTLMFETKDKGQRDAWIHRSYISK